MSFNAKDHDPLNHYDDLYKLVEEAAPIMAVLAYKGGSLFAKTWLDRAKELGIDIQNPSETKDCPTELLVNEPSSEDGS